MKPTEYPASKHFFVMIETSVSNLEVILNARFKSPFMLFLLYILGIRKLEKAGNLPGFQNTFFVTEPLGLTLKVVSRNLVGWILWLILCFYDRS